MNRTQVASYALVFLIIGAAAGAGGIYLYFTNGKTVQQGQTMTTTGTLVQQQLPPCAVTYSWEIDALYPNDYVGLHFNSSGAFVQIVHEEDSPWYRVQNLNYSQVNANLVLIENRSTWSLAPGEFILFGGPGQSPNCILSQNFSVPVIVYWVRAVP